MPDRETDDAEQETAARSAGATAAGATGGTALGRTATTAGAAGGAAVGTAGTAAAGTTGATTAGTAGGTAAGTAGGTAAGTAGTAGGTAAGTTGGTAAGTAGGTTAGTPAGFTGAPPPGFTDPPPPGFTGPPPGFTGATRPSIFTNGWLIAAAAVVAAIIAAVAAFFVLRPNPPQQTAAQQSPTATASPAPGATPGATTPDGPLLRGTYSEHGETRSIAGTSTFDNVATITSDCPGCDATIAGDGGVAVFQWNGSGWQMQSTGPICAGDTITLTPTVVVNGIVQELSTYLATCNGTVRSSTMTRIGD